MTLEAVLEIIDAFLAMFGGCLRLVMAGVAGPRIQCRLVTTAAGIIPLTVIHWKHVRTVIAGWLPT